LTSASGDSGTTAYQGGAMRLRSIIMPVLFATVCAVGCSAHGTPTSEPNVGFPVQVEPDNPSYYAPGVTSVSAQDIDFRLAGCIGKIALFDLQFSVAYTGQGQIGVLVGSDKYDGIFYKDTLNAQSDQSPVRIMKIRQNNGDGVMSSTPQDLTVVIKLIGGSVHQIYYKSFPSIPAEQCAGGYTP
jgi:hypothetical protein